MISLMPNWNLFKLHLHHTLHYLQNQNTHPGQILWFLVLNLVSSMSPAILTPATLLFPLFTLLPFRLLLLIQKTRKKEEKQAHQTYQRGMTWLRHHAEWISPWNLMNIVPQTTNKWTSRNFYLLTTIRRQTTHVLGFPFLNQLLPLTTTI